MYSSGAVVDRDKMIEFRGQKVNDHSRSGTTHGQLSTIGGISSPISGMHKRTLTKLIKITHYQVHMTMMTFLRSRIQRSRSRTTFLA